MARLSGVGIVSPVASVMSVMTGGGAGACSTTGALTGLMGCEGGGMAALALAML